MKLTIRWHIRLALAGREKCISVMNSIGIALASGILRLLQAALLADAYPANHEGYRKTIHFPGIAYLPRNGVAAFCKHAEDVRAVSSCLQCGRCSRTGDAGIARGRQKNRAGFILIESELVTVGFIYLVYIQLGSGHPSLAEHKGGMRSI
jgi:hypothetical protein